MDIEFDRQHIWHPYTSAINPLPCYPVKGASGTQIFLEDGSALIDGMASWWSAIHGYNHPQLNRAAKQQIDDFSHVMFGGLTHSPAIELCQKLINITPNGLERVFLADSGSVSVEVAMKLAIQYWACQGNKAKCRFIAPRNGYHGDTLNAMSVCDPINGMHSLFNQVLPEQLFAPAPQTRFNARWNDDEMLPMEELLQQHHHEVAAIILEPIVQGAGGMRMYHPDYLRRCRQLCDQYNVLLIADEIATGFGRTGKLFACEHAEITPDILCLGKALTGGYVSLAATLCTEDVAMGVCQGQPGVFMHGPTFMGNPLACAIANQSIDTLQESDWSQQVSKIEHWLENAFRPCAELTNVEDVRVLGAIGVVETKTAYDTGILQQHLVNNGVWIRPFGKLIYVMPPYIIQQSEVELLGIAIYDTLKILSE